MGGGEALPARVEAGEHERSEGLFSNVDGGGQIGLEAEGRAGRVVDPMGVGGTRDGDGPVGLERVAAVRLAQREDRAACHREVVRRVDREHLVALPAHARDQGDLEAEALAAHLQQRRELLLDADAALRGEFGEAANSLHALPVEGFRAVELAQDPSDGDHGEEAEQAHPETRHRASGREVEAQ